MAGPNKPETAQSQRGPQPQPQSAGQPQSMAAQPAAPAPANVPPASEVEQLKARLAAMEAKLNAVLDGQKAAAAAPIQAAHASAPLAPQVVLPASEVLRQRQDSQRAADDAARQRNADRNERELVTGQREFDVSLKHNPTRRVGASSDMEAREKYRRYFGINSTQHEIVAVEVGGRVA